MKMKFAVIMVMALVASTSFAQDTSDAEITQQSGISSKGFRMGLIKPILDLGVTGSKDGASHTRTIELDDALGLTFGYASLPIQSLGWTANLAYIDIDTNETGTYIMRLDGNLAYAITDVLNIRGGLNISNTNNPENDVEIDLDPAIGIQGVFGVQVTKNFGLEIGYTQMNQTTSLNGVDIKVRQSGFELGLNYTF